VRCLREISLAAVGRIAVAVGEAGRARGRLEAALPGLARRGAADVGEIAAVVSAGPAVRDVVDDARVVAHELAGVAARTAGVAACLGPAPLAQPASALTSGPASQPPPSLGAISSVASGPAPIDPSRPMSPVLKSPKIAVQPAKAAIEASDTTASRSGDFIGMPIVPRLPLPKQQLADSLGVTGNAVHIHRAKTTWSAGRTLTWTPRGYQSIRRQRAVNFRVCEDACASWPRHDNAEGPAWGSSPRSRRRRKA